MTAEHRRRPDRHQVDRNQECVGQGVANTATGFIGGMAGCAMIGQSIINVKSGGRGRLSTFVAGRVPADPVVFSAIWSASSRCRRWWRS
jgi:SulP family sulfate permease